MKEQVVLEVLEDLSPDDESIAGVKALAASGYRIALDDFVFRPAFKRLLEIARIVKLDILALGPDGVSAQLDLLRDYPHKLVAEKVETPDELARCQAFGFDYFQGVYSGLMVYALYRVRIICKESVRQHKWFNSYRP